MASGTEGRQRRATYVRRRIAAGAIAVAVLGVGIYTPVTLLAPVPTVAAEVAPVAEQAQPAAAVATPGFGVSGIAAIDEPGVLAAVDDGAAHPIASISKTITALVVLQAKPMTADDDGATITLTEQDAAFSDWQAANGGSAEPATAGVVMTQRDVLELMLLPSANNYAQTLAAWAFGSEAAYVDAARAWLVEHGMTSTTINDASGYDDGNVSTVTDLLTLGRLVLADPVLAPIVGSTSADVPDIGTIVNSNALLGTDGVDGIKTGTAPLAGACLLFSADLAIGSQTVTVVGVVLGGASHAELRESVTALIRSVAAGYREVPVVTAGAAYADYGQVWGDTADAVAAEDATLLVWSDTPITTTVAVEPVSLADAGAEVGSVTVHAGTRSISVPLVLDATIDDPGPWWRLTNPGRL